jgi:uncharacterized Zn-binding protein involved in type VI secretion
MSRSVLQSIAAAAATLLVIGAAHVVSDAALCPRHRRWVRVVEQHDPVIRDDGYAFARTGEAIYACTSPDRLGPIVTWHQDLDCYCAPVEMDAEAVGRLLDGQCVVDRLTPTRADNTGACRHAHCGRHLDP